MSRLIVKNIPKHLSENELAVHFASKGGQVTDAKIMYKNNRSRLFGFVGFKNEEMAKEAQKYFNRTYLHTSKLDCEIAKQQNDTTLARPWSRHSEGSSAYERRMKQRGANPDSQMGRTKGEQFNSKEEVERKKSRFREFLKLMGKGQKGEAQMWNDQFESFMELDEDPIQKKPQEEGKKDDDETKKEKEDHAKEMESEFVDDKRLFLMNLSY